MLGNALTPHRPFTAVRAHADAYLNEEYEDMIFILDIILDPTGRGICEAEGHDVGGAVGVGSPRPLAFGFDLSAGGRRLT